MLVNDPSPIDDISAALAHGRSIRDQGPYKVLIGNALLQYRSVVIADPVVTGAQILQAANVDRPVEHVLFAVLTSGVLENIRPDETIDLRSRGAEKFLIFLSDKVYRLVIEDRPFDWGASLISGATLKHLVGIDNDEFEIWRLVVGGADEVIDDDEYANLAPDGVERFASKRSNFKIIVNAEQHEVHRRRLTYWEVVQLAFPGSVRDPNVAYTVDYDRGPRANPEGSMVDTQSVKLKNGMVFYVAVSDKS